MSMYTINPGDFKHKFELQELRAGIDDDNIPIEEWITIWTAKGRVRNNTANNKDIESGDRTFVEKVITARFPKHLQGFDVEDANKYKILHKGKLYKIVSMSDIREENKYIQIKIGAWE